MDEELLYLKHLQRKPSPFELKHDVVRFPSEKIILSISEEINRADVLNKINDLQWSKVINYSDIKNTKKNKIKKNDPVFLEKLSFTHRLYQENPSYIHWENALELISSTFPLPLTTNNDDSKTIKLQLAKKYYTDQEKFAQFYLSKNTASGFLSHETAVKNYLKIPFPFRGLLLYIPCGIPKIVCPALAIAEGMKEMKNVLIFSAISFSESFMEMQHDFYKQNNHWIFHKRNQNDKEEDMLGVPKEFLNKYQGIWLANAEAPPNFHSLLEKDQASLSEQLNLMTKKKYTFLSFAQLHLQKMQHWTKDFTENFLNNKVIILDQSEGNKLVSAIQYYLSHDIRENDDKDNKKNIQYEKEPMALLFYRMLLSATNVKIIFITYSRPSFNFPNEIGILFNILSGYFFSWKIKLKTNKNANNKTLVQTLQRKFPKQFVFTLSEHEQVLAITKNPFLLENTQSVSFFKKKNPENNEISFQFFSKKEIISEIIKQYFHDAESIIPLPELLFPDTMSDFSKEYMKNNSEFKNIPELQQRILGFFAIDNNNNNNNNNNNKIPFQIFHIPLSTIQFDLYQKAIRKVDFSDLEKNSYAFSLCQLICNFAIPDRPVPLQLINNNNNTSNYTIIEKEQNGESFGGPEYINAFREKIAKEMELFVSSDALKKFSPKFHILLSNIQNAPEGCLQVICSSYEKFEGLELFAKILEFNGYAKFEIEKDVANRWVQKEINQLEDAGKPRFLHFTGKETPEEIEILQNIFLSKWDDLPESITYSLRSIAHNNYRGQIIQLNLFPFTHVYFHPFFQQWKIDNSKFIIHGMEPSMNPEFLNAFDSLCLEKEEQMKIFLYIAIFSEAQEKKAKEPKKTIDQWIYEIFLDRKNRNAQFFSMISKNHLLK